MIKGITDANLMPRIDKIRIGTKNDRNLPVALDYFLVPDRLKPYVGDQPKELEIMFPSDDIETNFPHQMKRYGNNVLLCRGNGETGVETNPKTGEKKLVDCQTCPFRNNQCKPTGVLRFLLPAVPGLGIYQIDTRGLASIQNIISGMKLLANLTGGRIRMIPLKLTIEKTPAKYRGEGGALRDTTINALKLNIDTTPVELIEKYFNPNPTTIQLSSHEFNINAPSFDDYVEGIDGEEPDPFENNEDPYENEEPEDPFDNHEEDTVEDGAEFRNEPEVIRAKVVDVSGLQDGTLCLTTDQGVILVPPDYPDIERRLNSLVGKEAEYLVIPREDGYFIIAGSKGNEIKVLSSDHQKSPEQGLNKNQLLLELKKRAGTGDEQKKFFKIATMTLNKDISNFGQISKLTLDELSLLLQKVS